MLGILASEETFYAASDVYGLMYAATNAGHLYVIDTEHPADMIYVGAMGLQLTDLAFSRADDTLYGVTKESELYAVDRMTANVQYIGQIGVETNTLACDGQGNFYSIVYGTKWSDGYESGNLCRFTLETLSSPEILTRQWQTNTEVQSLEWNPNDGRIYWASYYRFYTHGGQFEHLYNDIYSYDVENQLMSSYSISQMTLTSTEYRHLSCLTLPEKRSCCPVARSCRRDCGGTAGRDWADPDSGRGEAPAGSGAALERHGPQPHLDQLQPGSGFCGRGRQHHGPPQRRSEHYRHSSC